MIMETTHPTLSLEQQQALEAILEWYNYQGGPKEFTLGGYAGTGKTTLIRELINTLYEKDQPTLLAAFTGKAVNVLQRKGLTQAQTLHSLMYNTWVDEDGGYHFDKKQKLDSDAQLVIVDEASMVSTELYKDLLSFGVKLLFVGDPGQLEPVGSSPNLMRSPTITLTTIHRQAENSPIITFASDVRSGGKLGPISVKGLDVRMKSGGFPIKQAMECSQVICAKNATKQKINGLFRSHLRAPQHSIQFGDKIMILRNNTNFGVFNGMILFIDSIEDKGTYWMVSARDEIQREFHKLPIWKEPFGNPTIDTKTIPPSIYLNKRNCLLVHADFAYAITCHKSQGSEWESVMVWDESSTFWDMKRWRYTAITRASAQLTYLY